jgi:flagellar motor component MotA
LESSQIVNQISETDPKDIQQNAANQINLLTKYYENGLSQAKASFNWAITMAIVGFIGYITAIILFINNIDKTGALVSTIGASLTQFLAGSLFWIYQKTLTQLNNYNSQMNNIQNYLLANSFIESLEGNAKELARMDLIKRVANISENNKL